ncbi:MAG: BtrH N-terminal domain-containing protein [Candidatus Hodarchaeota archaeon]
MPFSEKIKNEVRNKAFHRCSICHRLETIQIHHIIPQNEGGPDDQNNATPLCTNCHKIYGSNPLKRKFLKEKRDEWYNNAESIIYGNTHDRERGINQDKGIIINNLIHRIGFHCESSSLRDLFEFYGFPMSEPMAFGLDATLGFGFFDTTGQVSFMPKSDIPFFLGGKQGTIEPNSLACRLLGITLRKQSFTNTDKAWEESKRMLKQNTPLILRVDIAYMPYEGFDDEMEEAHFGGHAVVLGGYNEEIGIAYIGDTEFEGFQEVPIDILKTARSSTYGPKFMHPGNTQFSMTRRVDGKHPPLAAGVKLAIQKVVNNMLRPSMNSNGIQGLKQFANSILTWGDKLNKTITNSKGNEISLGRMMFELMHGYIETWGTGGGSFRKLYKEFLEELLSHPELKEGPRAWNSYEFGIIEECIPIISDSAQNWTLIAETLKNAGDEYKDDCINHVDFGELHNTVINILTKEEELFTRLSKIKN